MKKRRTGVFGGTFDPIHIGHLIMATELRFHLSLDQVLFVPAGDPPHKPGQPISPIIDRLAMLECAIGGRSGFSVSLVDIERAGPSYTQQTLQILHDDFPADDLVFLMGEDSLRDLPTWHKPERILELASIGVGARPGIEVDLASVHRALSTAIGRITLIEIPLIGVSSSDIRRRVRMDEPIAFQVPGRVEEYIQEHDLYRTVRD